MKINFSKVLFIISFCFLAVATCANAQNSELTIISTSENMMKGGVISVEGQSQPNAKILLSVKTESYNFVYSAIETADSNGKWSAQLDQPLKTGKYYIEAAAQNLDGSLSAPVTSNLIEVRGPFAIIIAIFSILVVLLLASFLAIWYASKSSEIKRYKRILASQSDIIASYNILKKDLDRAMSNLDNNSDPEWRLGEIKFHLTNLKESLEKMNKYVTQGINVIGEYDVVSKIDKTVKPKH